jgi:hypothetical protein
MYDEGRGDRLDKSPAGQTPQLTCAFAANAGHFRRVVRVIRRRE